MAVWYAECAGGGLVGFSGAGWFSGTGAVLIAVRPLGGDVAGGDFAYAKGAVAQILSTNFKIRMFKRVSGNHKGCPYRVRMRFWVLVISPD